jgi:glycosyltransferase involved in cell wall biosynthesis
VRQHFPNVRLVIVGEDDPRAHPGGGSFRAELEAQVDRLGLRENVVFTGFQTDVARLVAAFDIYAMPTWEEPYGMVFLEAMAMRKPVVAWANGGPLEIVKEGETGFLTEPHDTAQLAEAILKLLRDPALARQFGDAGRRRVEEALNPQQMCDSMLGVYERTLDGNMKRRDVGAPQTARVP